MADKIITHPATDEYRAGYDRIFGKPATNRLLTPREMNEVYERAIDEMVIEMSMPKDCKLGV